MNTEKTAQTQTLPNLVKGVPTFKMIIPEAVEDKIRYLQRKYPFTEWSGVLFYKHSGSFEDGSLTVTCYDIYPMDLGNSTYTEFFMSEEVTAYMASHCDELWECDLGLVHSHHSMATFFSGTDLATLRSEGNDRNCFVSLIVNNEGTYSAAITRKVHVSSSSHRTASYRFFGDDEALPVSVPDTVDEYDEIEYFMLNIEKPDIHGGYPDIDARFDEILLRKAAVRRPELLPESRRKQAKELPLFPEQERQDGFMLTEKEKENSAAHKQGENAVSFDPKMINDAVAKLLLCSMLINPDKIDLERWARDSMCKIYRKRFGDPASAAFTEYAEFMVEYLITHFFDRESEEQDSDEGPLPQSDWYWSDLASALYDALSVYEDNPYLQAYRSTLEFYM